MAILHVMQIYIMRYKFDRTNRFLDPENICLDTKIITLSEFARKLQHFFKFCGHLVRHLEFKKSTPTRFGYYYVKTNKKCKEMILGEYNKVFQKMGSCHRTIILCTTGLPDSTSTHLIGLHVMLEAEWTAN